MLLATEGILTARLQQDPLLSGFRTVILDEFHERSIHADLGLALVRQAWLARDDLRIVVMSATMDADAVAGYLDGCPVVAVAAGRIPSRSSTRRNSAWRAASSVLSRVRTVTCSAFWPARPRSVVPQRKSRRSPPLIPPRSSRCTAALSADEQDDALKEVARRRVILATNIAETSLTVPACGRRGHRSAQSGPLRSGAGDRQPRDRAHLAGFGRSAGRPRGPCRGRCGLAAVGRVGPVAPSAQAEIHRIDLAAVVLAVLSWGGDPYTLAWFDAPARYSLDAAFELLRGLGAVSGSRITAMGTSMQRLPLHPRLARILLAAGGAGEAALACAVLSERHYTSAASHASSNDLQTIVEDLAALPAHITRVARQLSSLVAGRPSSVDERSFRRALFTGYPDRVARRRAPGSPKALLASGHGAYVGPESGVRDGEFLVAIDVTASQTAETSEARIRMAAMVDREWLEPTDGAAGACL